MATEGKLPFLGFKAGAIHFLTLFGFSPNPAKEKLASSVLTGSVGLSPMAGSAGFSPLAGSAGLAPMTGSVGDD